MSSKAALLAKYGDSSSSAPSKKTSSKKKAPSTTARQVRLQDDDGDDGSFSAWNRANNAKASKPPASLPVWSRAFDPDLMPTDGNVEADEDEDDVPVIVDSKGIAVPPEQRFKRDAFKEVGSSSSNSSSALAAPFEDKEDQQQRPMIPDAPKYDLPMPDYKAGLQESGLSHPKKQQQDLSPPRRKRHDSDDEDDGRNKQRAADLSPPRKKRHDSDDDEDLAPPRKQKDLSPPRRRRHDSDDEDDKGNGDLSPPRRPQRAPSPTHPRAPQIVKASTRTGLQTAAQIQDEVEEKKRDQQAKLKAFRDQPVPVQETVYRDKEGKKIDLQLERAERKAEERKKLEEEERQMAWGKGLVQKREREARALEFAKEAAKPFARYADDSDMNSELMAKDRWGDPMAAYFSQKKKEQSNVVERPKYRGPPPPPNRFGIAPGYRWDGVDRSTGFENRLLSAGLDNESRAIDAYKYSVSDL